MREQSSLFQAPCLRQCVYALISFAALWIMPSAWSPAVAQYKSWWEARGQYDTTSAAATQLPAPAIAAGELPRPCPEADVREQLRVLRDGDQAFRLASGEHRATLNAWARMHFRYRRDSCIETEYVVRKFQAAIGTPITGVLSVEDVQRLEQARGSARQVLGNERSGTGLPRTVVDFLPRASQDARQSCAERVQAMRREIAGKVNERMQSLPPQMYRSGVVANVQREVTAEYLVVAPAWTEYWYREPVLGEWAKRNDCESDLRFMVEHWQRAIGAPVDARDPQAIARTEELLAKAKSDHAAFASQQQQGFAAAAAASGETAKARVWALDDLSSGSSLQQVLDRMPTAFCTATDREVSCDATAAACQAETDALQAATRAHASMQPWVKPGSMQTPESAPGREQAALKLRLAQSALERCKAQYPHSAAANSRITFAGQEVGTARLEFDGKGLATLRIGMKGSPEPARTLLTRRYGKVETQQEVRTRDEAVISPGATGYVAGVGTVTTAPTMERVPVSYSVTRYIWTAPNARVEESTGNFVFRFFN